MLNNRASVITQMEAKTMKKKVIAFLMTLTMTATLVSGCSSKVSITTDDNTAPEAAADAGNDSTDAVQTENNKGSAADFKKDKDASSSDDKSADADASKQSGGVTDGPLLGSEEIVYYDKDLVPSVKDYEIKEDFSNVFVEDMFKGRFGLAKDHNSDNGDDLRKALAKNGFSVIGGNGYSEFFDIYEDNRYVMFPSFITVDSLMHTYHLYFAYLMRTCERDYISAELQKLSKTMLKTSAKQLEELEGTDWEIPAIHNVVFFYIGAYLQDDSTEFPVSNSEAKDEADRIIKNIMSASGIEESNLTGRKEDYSQYKPRGYYTNDDVLEKYFRAMMWYGRCAFELDKNDGVRSAILMNLGINDVGKESWEAIYNITSFFAGKSDDPGFADMMPIIMTAYGGVPSIKDLPKDDGAVASVQTQAEDLPTPKINSIPIEDGEEPVKMGYRFMGQRFTIDAAIMQRLIYSAVKENGEGLGRYLPDTLDVPAVLGSAEAIKILEEQGDLEYEGYTDNMVLLKKIYANDDPENWNANLSTGWLHTLRPLFEEKGEGYPKFMQSEEWKKKTLETFAGSYAELKHDTILYAKQIYAEMGGGEEEVLDDRGYVEPEPVVYSRFIFLSDKTKEGLEGYNMLSDSAKEDLERLSEIARTLLTISEKELKEEALTDEEYDFIRDYGGDLEHFWVEAMKDKFDGDLAYSYQASCPVIADIATDPNGTVLEVGSGEAQAMYVVFPIDGELRVGSGSVYSFYQFTMDINDRLTDEEWKDMLNGGHFDDNYQWIENSDHPEQPKWTQSYRIKSK